MLRFTIMKLQIDRSPLVRLQAETIPLLAHSTFHRGKIILYPFVQSYVH